MQKFTHACVRLTVGSTVLVIDPGIWSEPQALRGADAVLVTHEHADHVDRLRLKGLSVPVFAPEGADIPDVDFTPVAPGTSFEAAGVAVRAVGGRHATIYGGLPDCANVGYVVEGLYHPGDSLHVPAEEVDTLLVPAHGSWLKTCEAIDFIREINPRRAFPIHDAQINERGLESVNGWFGEATATDYRYLSAGESTT